MSQKWPPLEARMPLAQVTLQSQEGLEASSPAAAGWAQFSHAGSWNVFHITCEVSQPAALPAAHLSLPLLGGDFWLPCCLSFTPTPTFWAL